MLIWVFACPQNLGLGEGPQLSWLLHQSQHIITSVNDILCFFLVRFWDLRDHAGYDFLVGGSHMGGSGDQLLVIGLWTWAR